MKAFVEPLADYFEANGLIFDHPHSVQLTSSNIEDNGGSIILKMVANQGKKEIPGNKMKNVTALENDLKQKVFEGANFRIAICNANFVEYNQ